MSSVGPPKPRFPGRGDLLLACVLLAMIALIVGWGPAAITRALVDLVGRQQQRVVPPAPEAVLADFLGTKERHYIDAIAAAAIETTLSRFASLPSRIPGYGGLEEAGHYIHSEFEGFGLEQVRVDTFAVTVPVDQGGELEIFGSGQRVPLHALWPNQVRTSTTPAEGISGPLIEGGHGDFAEFNGRVVDGSIVLLGFGCGLNYLNARMLGAAAILFYDDGRVSREQAADKFLKIPAEVPRFWLAEEAAQSLRQRLRLGEEIQVRLRARMDWERVPSYNIYGYLPGADEPIPGTSGKRWKDRVIVLSAYCDAMSVVPALAPGAESACGFGRFIFLGIGGAFYSALNFLRARFIWWPLHPIGLTLASSWPLKMSAF